MNYTPGVAVGNLHEQQQLGREIDALRNEIQEVSAKVGRIEQAIQRLTDAVNSGVKLGDLAA